MDKLKLSQIRSAVANYMESEGCSCCSDYEAHKRHTEILAKLLDVPMYDDCSGYNFKQFADKLED